MAIFLFPIYLAVINSIKPLGNIIGSTLAFPKEPYWNNYHFVVEEMNYTRAFANTFLVTIVSVLFIVVLGSMCAYRLARTGDRKSSLILMLFFSSMIIPFQTIMLPLARVAKWLHFVDSLPGYIAMVIPLFSPFAIFMYHGFVKNIPVGVEEAATIDGCSPLSLFFRIVFPMLTPITSSVVVLNALWVWNDFSLPLIMLRSADKKTITINIYTFFSSVQNRWDYALAGLMLSSLPILIFYIFMQKYIIKGTIAGAIKG